MQPTHQLGYLLHHLSFVIDRQSDQILQERLGLGFSQFKILMALSWHGDVRQKHIAESLGQTEASISRQIQLMRSRAWLETKLNPRNRREHVIVLSAKGGRMLQKALSVLNIYHEPMFGSLSDKQQESLAESLKVMHLHVCQSGRAGACRHLDS